MTVVTRASASSVMGGQILVAPNSISIIIMADIIYPPPGPE